MYVASNTHIIWLLCTCVLLCACVISVCLFMEFFCTTELSNELEEDLSSQHGSKKMAFGRLSSTQFRAGQGEVIESDDTIILEGVPIITPNKDIVVLSLSFEVRTLRTYSIETKACRVVCTQQPFDHAYPQKKSITHHYLMISRNAELVLNYFNNETS